VGWAPFFVPRMAVGNGQKIKKKIGQKFKKKIGQN